MSKLNDADFVVDQIMQIFARFNSKPFVDYSPKQLGESRAWNVLLDEFLLLNEQMKTYYSRFRHDDGKAIVRAFRYAYFGEPYKQDSYDFEAPRFNLK